ncbi:hypothetical protein [Acinetobacter nectaris]|uniref:hypothetical protein n=1 Tax=Acinetobacter nectaris TaxID=1219382 RepID=UPI001F44F1D2|nr:hypothetical protein [Acinetobacter nectaris]MCF9035300.1 hypothetical protein [Acinetobacter nectaris]
MQQNNLANQLQKQVIGIAYPSKAPSYYQNPTAQEQTASLKDFIIANLIDTAKALVIMLGIFTALSIIYHVVGG